MEHFRWGLRILVMMILLLMMIIQKKLKLQCPADTRRRFNVYKTSCVYWVTPATPPILEAPPPGISTQVRGIKILPPKQLLRDYQYFLHKYRKGIHLKICWMRLNKLSIHCMEQSRSPKVIQLYIQINIKMSTIITNFENRNTSNTYKLRLNLRLKEACSIVRTYYLLHTEEYKKVVQK